MSSVKSIFLSLIVFFLLPAVSFAQNSSDDGETPFLEPGDSGPVVVIPWGRPLDGSSKVATKETTGSEYRKSMRIHRKWSGSPDSSTSYTNSAGECEGEQTKDQISRKYYYGRDCIGGTEYVCHVYTKTTTSSQGGIVCRVSHEVRIDCWYGLDCEW